MTARRWSASALVTLAVAAILNGQGGVAEQECNRAIELAGQGDLKAAEEAARKSLQSEPRAARTLALLGMILTREERLEEAAGYLEQALRLDARRVAARFNLALNQFRLGRLDAARRNLEMVRREQPGHAAAALLLGTILAAEGECGDALPLLEQVPELAQRQPESRLGLARCYYLAKQLKRARDVLSGASDRAAVLLAVQFKDFETADALLARLRREQGGNSEVAYLGALVDYNAERWGIAQATLEKLVEGGAQDADVFDLLAWCRHREGRAESAVAAMEEAVQREPSSGIRHLHLAQMLLEQKRYAEAYAAAEQATQGSAAGFLAYKLKGDAELTLGMLKQAEESYLRAASRNPRDPDSLLALAIAQQRVWKYAEARASLQKGLREFPHDARFPLHFGELLSDPGAPVVMQSPDAAVSHLERALALDASLAEAHYELGKLSLRRGHAAEALSHLEAAAQLDPSNPQIRLALAKLKK